LVVFKRGDAMKGSAEPLGLSEFILARKERILEDFEEFARTHTEPGATMDIVALRDHAAEMLAAIAVDIERPQSKAAEERKSKGDAPEGDQARDTAAEKHGDDRAWSGFSLEEMFSEYRALRASVLRLWIAEHGPPDRDDVVDLIRFNEAIDQALAESVTRFSVRLDKSREMFLAILGHDLRNPLSAIVTGASFLVDEGGLTGRNRELASRIHSSGKRMSELVGDLLDFTSSRLGTGIPITPTESDLAEVAHDVIEEVEVSNPGRVFRFEAIGDLRGSWDSGRVRQALGNLIANAVQHGSADTPVTVSAAGEADEVTLSIHNLGRVITAEDRRHIFKPFRRGESSDGPEALGSMGLGLYIARQIVIAHGGRLTVDSSPERGTTFELRLPRR